MKHHHPVRSIPLKNLDVDPDSRHPLVGTDEEEHRLRASIEALGILSPLVVCRAGKNHFIIIDGQRRYRIARDLGIKELDCVINPPMGGAQREALRFHLYITFKPLTQAERVRQRRRLRQLGIVPPGEVR